MLKKLLYYLLNKNRFSEVLFSPYKVFLFSICQASQFLPLKCDIYGCIFRRSRYLEDLKKKVIKNASANVKKESRNQYLRKCLQLIEHSTNM